MPKVDGLTAKECDNAKPQAKEYRKPDLNGLYLTVRPNGGKSWKHDFRFNGRMLTITYGRYPEVSLAEARRRHAQARELIAKGINPIEEAKREKEELTRQELTQGLTFGKVVSEWMAHIKAELAPSTYHKKEILLAKHLLPLLADKLIREISFQELKAILQGLEADGHWGTRDKVLYVLTGVFDFAVVNDYLTTANPAAKLSKIATKQPAESISHRPALTEPEDVGEALRKIEEYVKGHSAGPYVEAALRLLPMIPVRIKELVGATWDEIDIGDGTWDFRAERMKVRKPYRAYLSKQAKAILEELKDTRQNDFVFFGTSATGHVTGETVLKATRNAGISQEEHCLHGWRSTMSTKRTA